MDRILCAEETENFFQADDTRRRRCLTVATVVRGPQRVTTTSDFRTCRYDVAR